jgi:predicted Zn-ribbon and HTH transcriptional regulator
MEGILENEQYNIKTRCKECGIEYNEKILGAFINRAKNYCPECKVKTEVLEVKPVRQVIME